MVTRSKSPMQKWQLLESPVMKKREMKSRQKEAMKENININQRCDSKFDGSDEKNNKNYSPPNI